MIPTWALPILALLAVCRLTRMATVDRIPVGRLRQRLVNRGTLPRRLVTRKVRAADGRMMETKLPAWYAELVVCPWCMSVWIAAGYAALCWWQPGAMGWVSLALTWSLAVGAASRWTQ
jgi:hypothetical protein